MRTLFIAALAATSLLTSFASPATAAPNLLVVNATNDLNDGACDTPHCSFREALIDASVTPGGDRVVFDRAIFPRDQAVTIQFVGPSMGNSSWSVPDDTEIDGTGADVILRGPHPTLGMGSHTFVHSLTVDGPGSAGFSIWTWGGDENAVSDNTLIGVVAIRSSCDEAIGHRGNRILRNVIVGGVDVRGYPCGVDGTVLKSNHISGGSAGIALYTTSNTTITANTFTENRYGIELEWGASDVLITRNNIAGNTDYGLVNAAAPDLEAKHNWWGSEDGPSGDGPGTGDAIYGDVDVVPWRRHPVHTLE